MKIPQNYCSLRTYLLKHLPSEKAYGLIQNADSNTPDLQDYTDMLNSVFISCPPSFKTFSYAFDTFQRAESLSQDELVDQCIITMLKTGQIDNVLTKGYQLGNDNQNTSSDLSNSTINYSSNVLKSLPWRILLSRIGTQQMSFIIIKGQLYLVSDSNRSAIQLTGSPPKQTFWPKKPQSNVNQSLAKKTIDRKRFMYKRSNISTIFKTETIQLMEEIFPSQFKSLKVINNGKTIPPKRLRNLPLNLVEKMRANHFKNFPSKPMAATLLDTAINNEYKYNKDNPHNQENHNPQLKPNAFYSTLLDNYCPLIWDKMENAKLEEGYYVKKENVSTFCCEVFTKLTPFRFFGCDKNKRIFLKNISILINGHQDESLIVNDLLKDLNLKTMDWLAPLSSSLNSQKWSLGDFNKRKEILIDFLIWTFDILLPSVISNFFYVTECNDTSKGLFYYRHESWKRLTKPAIDRYTSTNLEQIWYEESLYKGRIRLLPKHEGFRVICKQKPNFKETQYQTFRRKMGLRSAMKSIRYERIEKRPNVYNSSMDSIYKQLLDYKQKLKSKNNGKIPKLYVIKFDINHSFDTIQVQSAIDLACDTLIHNEYILREVAIAKDLNSSIKSRRTIVLPGNEDSNIMSSISKLTNEKEIITSDTSKTSIVKKKLLCEALESHISDVTIKIGKKTYARVNGVPQGSEVSPLLCELVYDELVDQKFSFLDMEDDLILRYIDDFALFITQKERANKAYKAVIKGFANFDALVNPDKTITNFVGGDFKNDIPYCGLTIHTQSLEVSKDKFREIGYRITDSTKLKTKLHNLAKVRISNLLLDLRLNSEKTILNNLFNVVRSLTKHIAIFPENQKTTFNIMTCLFSDCVKLSSKRINDIPRSDIINICIKGFLTEIKDNPQTNSLRAWLQDQSII